MPSEQQQWPRGCLCQTPSERIVTGYWSSNETTSASAGGHQTFILHFYVSLSTSDVSADPRALLALHRSKNPRGVFWSGYISSWQGGVDS